MSLPLSKEEQTLHNPRCRCQESAASRPILIKENVILLNVFVIFQQSRTGGAKMQERREAAYQETSVPLKSG